jgi:hypothetical protein
MGYNPFVWPALGQAGSQLMNAAGEERASGFAIYIELDIIIS